MKTTLLVEPGDGRTRLPDGNVVVIRPLARTDATALRAFHARLSRETLYYRYFYFHGDLTDAEVDYLTGVDQHDRVALAVLAGDDLVGVGRYDVLPGTTDAELAFVVADDWQRHGIGSLLLDRLVDRARARGLRRLLADTLADNGRMIDVFRHAGYPHQMHWDAGCVRVAISLTSSTCVRDAERIHLTEC